MNETGRALADSPQDIGPGAGDGANSHQTNLRLSHAAGFIRGSPAKSRGGDPRSNCLIQSIGGPPRALCGRGTGGFVVGGRGALSARFNCLENNQQKTGQGVRGGCLGSTIDSATRKGFTGTSRPVRMMEGEFRRVQGRRH